MMTGVVHVVELLPHDAGQQHFTSKPPKLPPFLSDGVLGILV
jgi:hypothetical protein